MRSATFPPVHVEPQLLAAAERVLYDGETLSSFVERSIREGIGRRQLQSQFIARGIASRDNAMHTGRHVSSSDVLAGLQRRLDAMCDRQRQAR
ncbi:YlcI/YnfO family protein [Burkholderia pyrrocinia]|uniref:YlcI/YnfO family protein n=1 Tax=Burkholderia pyrrocinia TaxID=60550 RepID=UPI001FC8E40B